MGSDLGKTTSEPCCLLTLPTEILVTILRQLTTPSFIQTFVTCHKIFDMVAGSRDLILHHLHQIPGIKLGLEDPTLETNALFLLLRQRAAENLYGAVFNADCRDLRLSQGTLDPAASCLVDTTDYIGMSLVLKESINVRHYSSQGDLKAHDPDDYHHHDPSREKVLQVVHWKSTVTILYSWEPPVLSPPPKCCSKANPFHRLEKMDDDTDELEEKQTRIQYYLKHFNAYTNDPPQVFDIPDTSKHSRTRCGQRLVPLHLAVHNRLKCAILWGTPNKTDAMHMYAGWELRDYATTQILLYVSNKVKGDSCGNSYNPIFLYPLRGPSKSDASDSTFDHGPTFEKHVEYLRKFRPRAIAFTDGCRNLKLYRAGSLTPYAIIQSSVHGGVAEAPRFGYPRHRNEEHVRLETFKIETPFFGQHLFDQRSPGAGIDLECSKVYLHLATGTPGRRSNDNLDTGEADIYIIQNRESCEADDCDHVVDLTDTGGVYGDLRVVARLWGWNREMLTHSSLTALESVCISPKGTRIAIACWDRILVWSLNPEVLAEEWVQEERRRLSISSLASSNSNGLAPPISIAAAATANGDGSDASSVAASSHGEAALDSNAAMIKATKYYDLVRHHAFGEIVDLKPIVLKLPGGSIARKMMWQSSQTCDDESIYNEADINFFGYKCVNRLPDYEPSSSEEGYDNVSSRRRGRRNEDTDEFLYRPPSPLARDFDPGPTLEPEEVREVNSIGIELERLVLDNVEPHDTSPLLLGEDVGDPGYTDGLPSDTVAHDGSLESIGIELEKLVLQNGRPHETPPPTLPEGTGEQGTGDCVPTESVTQDGSLSQSHQVPLSDMTEPSHALTTAEQHNDEPNDDPNLTEATACLDTAATPKALAIIPGELPIKSPLTTEISKLPSDDADNIIPKQIQEADPSKVARPLTTSHPSPLSPSLLENPTGAIETETFASGLLDNPLSAISPAVFMEDSTNDEYMIRNRSRSRSTRRSRLRSWSPIEGIDRPFSPLLDTNPISIRRYADTESMERSRSRSRKRRPRNKRETEDELVVMTDRGVQIWKLGVWGRGLRELGMLD